MGRTDRESSTAGGGAARLPGLSHPETEAESNAAETSVATREDARRGGDLRCMEAPFSEEVSRPCRLV
jgi:hypothetical protein